jgi:hypothetical protein
MDMARQELCHSKAAIENALSESCDAFAYPNGNWSPETRELLVRVGFKLAFTTTRGAWTTDSDRLAIPRTNICEDNVVGLTRRFSVTMFEYTTFWKAWRATKAESRRMSSARQQHASVTV